MGVNGIEVLMQDGGDDLSPLLAILTYLTAEHLLFFPRLLEKARLGAVSGGPPPSHSYNILIGAIRRTPGHRLRNYFILVGVAV